MAERLPLTHHPRPEISTGANGSVRGCVGAFTALVPGDQSTMMAANPPTISNVPIIRNVTGIIVPILANARCDAIYHVEG